MEYLRYDGWTVTFTGIPEEKETSIPTLLCMGNGTIGIRGTVPELEDREQKGMFAAGFFDKLPRPELDYKFFNPFLKSWSYEEETKKYHLEEALVNCPDILAGYFEIDSERFFLDNEKKEQLIRSLDMKTGEIVFYIPVRTESGKKGLLTRRRFVSMKQHETVFEKCTLESTDFEGKVTYCAYTDTGTKNFNISGIYQDAAKEKDQAYYALYDVLEEEEEDLYTVIRGRCSGYKLYMAGSVQAEENGGMIRTGEKVSVVRRAAVLCDRIRAVGKEKLLESLREAERLSYEDALEESRKEWERIWEASDISIEGDIRTQTGIRHNLYLLNISLCRESDKVSVAAKGLTGEGYRGMVFWDTDIHMFPFFLYTQPDVARNIVSFRFRTLDGARAKAKKYGCRGASYPWETGTSGYEECEGFLKLITHQLHITADVAYAVGKYLQAVQDEEFGREEATEIFLETARFWISRGQMKDGKFCISQASGPDELHLESDDNAYVMNMVRHNLELAEEAAGKLREENPEKWEELVQKIGVTEEEISLISQYKNCIMTMKGQNGLYEQCKGFFNLEDRIVYENDPYIVPANTQTIKQADTIMLLYLLPELANKKELLENWNYYEPRTTHTSSLSYGVHGIIASKLGLTEKAEYYLDKSMGLDLFQPSSSCKDGAHLAAAGMSWSAVVNGIAGVEFKKEGISLDPSLPKDWEKLKLTLSYQGRVIPLEIGQKTIKVGNKNTSNGILTVSFQGTEYRIGKGEELCLSIS